MLEEIDQDLKTALKSGRRDEALVLRTLKSSLANARIAKRGELDEADYIKVLQKEAKQRRESIESFTAAGRQEQADKEAAELSVIERYLPKSLDEAELEALVADAIAETGAASASDMGQVMRQLQPKIAGRADGGKVAEMVRSKLQ